MTGSTETAPEQTAPKLFVAINAIHSHTGGGLVYLNKILPFLAREPDIDWMVIADSAHMDAITLPPNMNMLGVRTPKSMIKKLLWEQFALPFRLRKMGVHVTLCNANYVPLLAPQPVPIIHNNPRVAAYARSFYDRLYWFTLIRLTRLSLWRARAALSVAGHVIPTFAKGIWKGLAKKITVATPAAEKPETGEAIQLPVKTNPLMVLAVGDFYIQKDYATLLKAFARLIKEKPQAELHIIGRPLDKRVTKEMETIIRQENLEKAVTLHGPMPHDRLMGFFARAGLFISTSQVECFNMPVLEAMVCGTPVIAADLPFQHEVAGDAAVYIPVEKGGDVVAAYGMAMFYLLDNPEMAVTLGRKGLEQAGRFSWQATARTIADAVRKARGRT